MSESKVKQEVRQFYDAVGWQQVSEGVYQNAQYEDLRPVSRDYIHKCHLRVNKYLTHQGKYFLDAGSGPIQYPEYLSYSEGYQYRVCLDISIVALLDARERIRNHGLFVVADIARLPFPEEIFNDVVSLHTIHHLPPEDYRPAFYELKRVMKNGATAVIVNGWSHSPLMQLFNFPAKLIKRLFLKSDDTPADQKSASVCEQKPAGTFVTKLTADNLKQLLGKDFPIKISVWRSVSVRFLRFFIHPRVCGKFILEILFQKEEWFPSFFGKNGQYPLITFKK